MASRRRQRARKKTSQKSNPGITLGFDQPYMGIHAKYGTESLGKKKGLLIHTFDGGGECREETAYAVAHALKQRVVTVKKVRGSWRSVETQTHSINLDAPATKQPNATVLLLYNDGDGYRGSDVGIPCTRPGCLQSLIESFDALVGNVGVLLDPDWYQGDWWQTRPEECIRKWRDSPAFHYYGTSNYFLQHPSLLHIVLGLFRQVYLLRQQNQDVDLLGALNREDVVEALTNGDPELALQNLEKIRPWLEVGGNHKQGYPFPRGYWNRLVNLHKAIYNHGYEEVFGGSIEYRWGLLSQVDIAQDQDDFYDEEIDGDKLGGVWSYWGESNRTKAARRLATLARGRGGTGRRTWLKTRRA